MKENFINALVILKSIVDSIGTIQTARGLIVLLILIFSFILCIFTFTNRVNKSAKLQIQRFKKEGKYLPSVYVELNNSMECLRYFIFSYRWKKRIIRQYNHLFSGYEGKRLKQLPIFTAKCRLSYFSSLSKLKSTLSLVSDQLDELRKDHKELYDKYGDVIWAISNSTYNYVYAIKYLQDLCAMVSQKNMVLVGSAGNGKTSLLCRMAEVAISNKMPCMLVNSRDITEDCAEYIIKKLPIHPKLRHLTSLYLALTSMMLFFQRKYFYIFVDAINENDREIFISSISTLLETFSKYPRIRILLTCRREYFDSRYKTLFSAGEERPYIFNLHESEYDRRATRKLIESYMEHFNVRGPFSLETRKKLSNSLLLTRIFFEVNNNKNECMLEFRNAEIYKLYFEETAVKSKGVNLYAIVNSIAVYMFAEFQFDKIPIEKLNLSEDELNSLKGLLDNNLIISRSVYAGTGITEREEEYVYFVFDELRDFCLARYLLTLDETKASSEYATFFSNVTRLFEHRLSPTEGIVKYAYHYFRTIVRDDLCEKILGEFGESDVQSISEQENYGLDSQATFNNFGFSLIFSEGDNIASFEMNYMLRCIEKDSHHYWDIFWFLLGNEYSGFTPNIKLGVDILLHYKNDETPEKILRMFFADIFEKYHTYLDNKHSADNLKEWLDAIEKNTGAISENLKTIVVILAAYDPTEFAFEEYRGLVMNDELFEQIEKSDFCDWIKVLVSELRDSMISTSTDQNEIQPLIDLGDFEEYGI